MSADLFKDGFMNLTNKVVIITGGARGQGAAEAQLFASNGAKVIISDIDQAEGEITAEKIGQNVAFTRHDVTSEEDWRKVIDFAMERFHKLDVLINNAGVFKPCPIQETDTAVFDLQYRINQLGTFLGIRSVVEPMKKNGSGSIINLSSIAGLRGFPNSIGYCATKWAVRGMSKVAAAELAPYRIRVNSIHPGFIDTRMLDENPPGIVEQGIATTPLKRLGKPEEVARLAAFLASDESEFITGAEVAVDGGWVL
jgi:3alpha(or 20beta)-hydroxysteroid dehydrogenase